MSTSTREINARSNRLAVRITKPKVKLAEVTDGTPARSIVKPGRIVIEADPELTLAQMLAAFDPKRHSTELMVGGALITP